MTEEEFNNLMMLSSKYKNIVMMIDEFCDILTFTVIGTESSFHPITDRSILMSGLYAHINECSIWVNSNIVVGSIRVSNADITNSKELDKFSPAIPLALAKPAQFERIFNMKAFW